MSIKSSRFTPAVCKLPTMASWQIFNSGHVFPSVASPLHPTIPTVVRRQLGGLLLFLNSKQHIKRLCMFFLAWFPIFSFYHYKYVSPFYPETCPFVSFPLHSSLRITHSLLLSFSGQRPLPELISVGFMTLLAKAREASVPRQNSVMTGELGYRNSQA